MPINELEIEIVAAGPRVTSVEIGVALPGAAAVEQAEAEAGTSTVSRIWSAQRVWQAIAAWWATVAATKADASHTHPTSQVDGLDAALAGKAPATGIAPSAITGTAVVNADPRLADSREWTAATIDQAEAEAGTATTRRAWTALRVRQAIAAWWSTVAATKADASHTHPTSQVDGLDAALAGKAAASHTHPTSQVDGLDAALAGKAAASHTHPMNQVDGLDAALAGKAPATGIAPSAITGTAVVNTDPRLSDAREWTAATIDQVEAEAGTATTRRAWTALRVRQAIAAWWSAVAATKADASHTHPTSQVDGLDAALAGKAAASHTHPTSQVDGLDAALAGKAPATGIAPSAVTGTAVVNADPRLSDAREWTAATVDQAEAEAGTSTTRRAWTALRVRQAIAAWWSTVAATKANASHTHPTSQVDGLDAVLAYKSDVGHVHTWTEIDKSGATPNQVGAGTIATSNYTFSDSPPVDPVEKDIWVNTSTLQKFVRYGSAWVETSGAAVTPESVGAAMASVSEVAGAKTFSSQVELTGQAATNPTSAMTRALGDARYYRHFIAYKAASTSRSSTVVKIDDPDLILPVDANGIYAVEATLLIPANASNIQIAASIAIPSGTIHGRSLSGRDGGVAGTGYIDAGTSANFVNTRNGSIHFSGTVFIGVTGGSLSIQWAQESSSATAVVLLKGSNLIARKLN